MIERPQKHLVYTIGGFEFFDNKSAEFLYNQMKRAARIESAIYVKAVEDHEQCAQDCGSHEYEDFTAFFAGRLLGHWQAHLKMEGQSYREVVARMRELVNG
jgi:hypothetical protein